MKECKQGVFISQTDIRPTWNNYLYNAATSATSRPDPEVFTIEHLHAAMKKIDEIMTENVHCAVPPSDSTWKPDPTAAAPALAGVLSPARYPLITSSLLVDQITRHIRVPRSKKKRIRKKFHKLWTRTYTVPSQEVVVTDRFIACHPAIIGKLQNIIQKGFSYDQP